jgi:hypothetical protein
MKITLKPGGSYVEEMQPNSLRWWILKEIAPEQFVNVSCEIKCKDFFNDLAYTLQTGKSFTIYGFNAGEFGFKKGENIPMLLTSTCKEFMGNVEVFNNYLNVQDIPTIKATEIKEGVFISLDPWFWKNTYRVSLVSLIIRLLNNPVVFKDFNEIVAYKNYPTKDQGKWDIVVKKGKFFNTPKHLDKYVWYCGDDFNSETSVASYDLPGCVHNNGVISWSQHL